MPAAGSRVAGSGGDQARAGVGGLGAGSRSWARAVTRRSISSWRPPEGGLHRPFSEEALAWLRDRWADGKRLVAALPRDGGCEPHAQAAPHAQVAGGQACGRTARGGLTSGGCVTPGTVIERRVDADWRAVLGVELGRAHRHRGGGRDFCGGVNIGRRSPLAVGAVEAKWRRSPTRKQPATAPDVSSKRRAGALIREGGVLMGHMPGVLFWRSDHGRRTKNYVQVACWLSPDQRDRLSGRRAAANPAQQAASCVCGGPSSASCANMKELPDEARRDLCRGTRPTSRTSLRSAIRCESARVRPQVRHVVVAEFKDEGISGAAVGNEPGLRKMQEAAADWRALTCSC